MSTFVPNPGLLFYAVCVQNDSLVVNTGSTATVVKSTDRSHSGKVFRCVALDNHVVVGAELWDGYLSSKPSNKLLLRSDFRFEPLGPGVAAALGIEES